jgi:hypothetical protein
MTTANAKADRIAFRLARGGPVRIDVFDIQTPAIPAPGGVSLDRRRHPTHLPAPCGPTPVSATFFRP